MRRFSSGFIVFYLVMLVLWLGCAPRPVDLASTQFGCLSDATCREGLVCRRGGCVVPGSADDVPELCPNESETVTRCSGACVDLTVDPRHCGQCGAACELGSSCADGGCVGLDPEWANWQVPPEAPPATNYTLTTLTALDSQTGLMWQRGVAPTALSLADARTYCDGLRLDGLSGWRVPTVIELFSIFDTGHYPKPVFSPVAFSATNARMWTSSPQRWPVGTNFMRIIDPSTVPGVVMMGAVDPATPELVRCVRFGAHPPSERPHAFTGDLDGGVIADEGTGLTWQRLAPSTQMPMADAVAYCAGLELDGSGWRVPTYKELLTLFDVRRTPVLPAAFGQTQPEFYWYHWVAWPGTWPSTAIHAMFVDFVRGTVENRARTFSAYVRCVRP